MSLHRRSNRQFHFQRFTAIVLVLALIGLLAPLSVTAAALRAGEKELNTVVGQTWDWLKSMVQPLITAPAQRNGIRPSPPLTKAEREARVTSVEINPAEEVTLQSRQPLLFTAIPLDGEGTILHGLRPSWESSNKQVLFIRQDGQAMAGKAGKAIVTARAGNKHATVPVTVVEGTNEPFGGKKKVDSKRGGPQASLRQGG
jgi:hypothetical protein